MSRSTSTRWALSLSVCVSLSAPSALAQDAECAMQLNATEAVLERWPDLPERVRRAFAGRDAANRCARVSLEHRGRVIWLRVELEDGRSTSRSVRREDDVIPTLQALLATPRFPELTTAEPVASEPALGPSPTDPTPVDRAPAEPIMPEPAARSPGPTHDRGSDPSYDSSRQLSIEMSAVTSARVGSGDFTSLSVGLLTLADVSGWLLGFQGRAAEYAWDPSPKYGDSWGTLEVGALFGRRTRFDSWSLDFVSGPALAIIAGSTTETLAADAHAAHPARSNGIVPRVLLASHLTWLTPSAVRGFVGVEGEVGATGDTGASPHKLPVWMIGVAVGATLGSR